MVVTTTVVMTAVIKNMAGTPNCHNHISHDNSWHDKIVMTTGSQTCSYRSMRVLSGSLRDWIAWRTTSQWPWLISETKLSILSTVFKVIVVSSYRNGNRAMHMRMWTVVHSVVRHIRGQKWNGKIQYIRVSLKHSMILKLRAIHALAKETDAVTCSQSCTCRVARVLCRLFSFRYCWIRRMMLPREKKQERFPDGRPVSKESSPVTYSALSISNAMLPYGLAPYALPRLLGGVYITGYLVGILLKECLIRHCVFQNDINW